MNASSSPRWFNVALGLWLFASAFFWHHSARQFNNAWVVGVAAMILAVMATHFEEMKMANTALAVWLFISVWTLPVHSHTTFWNNLIVSVLMFMISLLPGTPAGRDPAGVHH